MVAPTLPHLSPAQRERLQQLADAARLRTALYPAPKPPPVQCRSRTRQYPAGRSSLGRTVRGRRRGRMAPRRLAAYSYFARLLD